MRPWENILKRAWTGRLKKIFGRWRRKKDSEERITNQLSYSIDYHRLRKYFQKPKRNESLSQRGCRTIRTEWVLFSRGKERGESVRVTFVTRPRKQLWAQTPLCQIDTIIQTGRMPSFFITRGKNAHMSCVISCFCWPFQILATYINHFALVIVARRHSMQFWRTRRRWKQTVCCS